MVIKKKKGYNIRKILSFAFKFRWKKKKKNVLVNKQNCKLISK